MATPDRRIIHRLNRSERRRLFGSLLTDSPCEKVQAIAMQLDGCVHDGLRDSLAVPALIYIAFNAGNPVAMRGWAIPTDAALAILDDMGRAW